MTARSPAWLCHVADRLAIYGPYVILAARTSGPEVTKEIKGGETDVQRVGEPINELEIIRVRKFIAAAKVERAASAGRGAYGIACFHSMYSADTLHPSPDIFNKNDL